MIPRNCIFVTFFIIKTFVYYYSIKVGGFSINEIPVNYQRPGIFLFLSAVQNATLIVIIKLLNPQKKNKLIYLLFIISTVVMITMIIIIVIHVFLVRVFVFY